MLKCKQHDERDCGAACFVTVLSYFGTSISLQEAREKVHTNMQGTNIFNIVMAGRKMALDTDAYKTNYSELVNALNNNEITTPFIAHITTEEYREHFVVVLKVGKNTIKIFDPAKGTVSYSVNKFCLLWTGHIISFAKTAAYIPQKIKKKNRVYKNIIKKVWTRYLITIILAIAVVLLSLIGTLGYEVVVDGVISDSHDHEIEIVEQEVEDNHANITDNEEIPKFGIFNELIKKIVEGIPLNSLFDNVANVAKVLIGLYLLQFFIQFSRDIIVGFLSRKIDRDIMNLYSNKILKLPLKFFQNISSGELLSRFTDLNEIRNLISGYSLAILFDVIVFVFGSIMMILINPILFLLILGVSFLYTILILGFAFSISKINRYYMSRNAKMVTDFKELTDGIDTIKLCGGKQIIQNKLHHDFLEVTNVGLTGNIVYSLQNAISVTLESISVIVALYAGAKLVLAGVITVGYLMTFSMLITYMLSPIKNLVEVQPAMQKAIVSLQRLNDVIYANEEIEDGIKKDEEITGDIIFENVSFSYIESVPVLKEINLNIKHKEKIMIKGKNGSGKSTLVKLLLAVYKPQKGKIIVNGHDVNEFSISTLRNNILYIPQDVFIFSATIRDNIIMGKENIGEEQINNILEIVKLKEFVEQLPHGLDTFLYENGDNLSGGQKQKIAIARALFRNPKVLIMDETTSQIDEKSCLDIIKVMFEKYPNITYLLISHNSNISDMCDREIVIE
ncbi:MAG: peptidase domain-containing ABC transporter [Oliverpabstia sp.]|nr:peptidase domain-containing ABC transporter [Oliverpabstia sp.]